jgi:hypothetical protein
VALRETRERYAAIAALGLSLLAIPTLVALNALNGVENALVAGLMALGAMVGAYQHSAQSRAILAVAGASTAILFEFCVFAVRQELFLPILNRLPAVPVELWGPAHVFFVVLSVSLFVLSVTYLNYEDKQSGLNLGRVAGGIAAVGLALTVFQAVKFLEFRSATKEYRRVQIAKPDARFNFKAPFNFGVFNFDVELENWRGDEWSDDERTRMRTFRDTIRATAALKRP